MMVYTDNRSSIKPKMKLNISFWNIFLIPNASPNDFAGFCCFFFAIFEDFYLNIVQK